MKKWMALALALVLVLGLTACAGNTNGGAQTGGSQTGDNQTGGQTRGGEGQTPVSGEDAKRITQEEAQTIALKDAGLTEDQVTRLHVEFDYDDGIPEYEVDFHQGQWEYEYEIHAETGEILHADKDRDD